MLSGLLRLSKLALLMQLLPVLCWYCYAVLLLLRDVVQVNVLIGPYLHVEQKNPPVFLLSCSLSLLLIYLNAFRNAALAVLARSTNAACAGTYPSCQRCCAATLRVRQDARSATATQSSRTKGSY